MDEQQKPAILQPITPPRTEPVEGHIPGGATAYMRKDILDAHIYGMSIPVLWEKSYLCPCRNRKTRQPAPACPVCHGRGVAFLPPEEIIMTIQSQEKGLVNTDLGLLDSGTAIGTPNRIHRISFRDRITIPSVEISQSLIFDATQKRIDHGFYLIYNVNEIELAVIQGRELVYGEDYDFNFDKNLFVPKQHLIGENISINIITQLRYMVADLLKEYRYAREMNRELIHLPQKLLLKREDIFIDKEHFEDSSSEGQMVDTKRVPVEGLNGFFGGKR